MAFGTPSSWIILAIQIYRSLATTINIVVGCVNINGVAFCHNTGDADCDDGHAVFQTGFSGYGDLAHKMEYPRWETDMHWNPDYKYIHIAADRCLYPQWSVFPIDEQCAFKPYDKSKGKVLNPYYELRWKRKELGLDAEGDPFNDYETASSGQNAPDDGGVSTDNQIASVGQITPSGNDVPDEAVVPVDQGTPDANSVTEYAPINQAASTADEESSDQFASTAPENTDTQDASLFQETASDDHVPNDTVNDDSNREGGSLNSRNQHEYRVSGTEGSKDERGNRGVVMKAKKRAWSPARAGVRWKA